MGQLTVLARRHGLAVIEDTAQAAGTRLHGKPVGTFGQAACFSFYPTKNMHSIEGGMIATPIPRSRTVYACYATKACSSATATRSSVSTPA